MTALLAFIVCVAGIYQLLDWALAVFTRLRIWLDYRRRVKSLLRSRTLLQRKRGGL